MTWDPNQGQGQPGGGQDPYSGYGTPQNPYGAPQNPYGTPPPQNPYGTPPPENPYATPGPGYQSSGYGAAYAVPPATPLPLGEAIRQLPNQYIKVLTKPSAQTFAEEMGKAEWGIVWVQLLIYAVIGGVLGFLGAMTNPFRVTPTTGSTTSSLNPATIQAITAGASFGSIIIIPIAFFIGVGIVYLFAKMFGGQGSFLQQAYTTLLFTVPIGIITGLLGLIPIVGTIGVLLGIYEVVLNVFSVMAVHRLSGGKATAAVLLPVAIFFLLACVLAIVFIAIIAAAVNGTR